ncbi:hypothetical protein AB0K00_04965 [Dactylosporangium sp. NPDC049525]|uniref:hypothetical protein n=1 Tax=Dactylosporangium sp. NPDC049525 TaxID=3154730 RepID=UPI00341D9A3D
MRGWWWRRQTLPKAEAQRLLDGGSGDSAVADLLRAASGPARSGELAGERAAVAAFRQEYAAGAGTASVRSELPRAIRHPGRRVAVLAAVLAAGVLAGTGVAAGAGRLPEPLQRAAHDWIDKVPEPDPRPRPEQTVRAASPTPPAVHRPAVTPTPTHPGTLAAADAKKLCKEWEKTRDDPHRKPMDPADLRALTAAAGGPERIEGYCGLTPTGPTPGPPGQPGPPSGTKSKKAARR